MTYYVDQRFSYQGSIWKVVKISEKEIDLKNKDGAECYIDLKNKAPLPVDFKEIVCSTTGTE